MAWGSRERGVQGVGRGAEGGIPAESIRVSCVRSSRRAGRVAVQPGGAERRWGVWTFSGVQQHGVLEHLQLWEKEAAEGLHEAALCSAIGPFHLS